MPVNDAPSVASGAAAQPGPAAAGDAPAERYRQRCAQFAAERDRLERRLRWVGYGRLLTFCLAVACAAWAFVSGIPPILLLAAAWLAAFVALVFYNERLSRAHRRARELWRLNDESLPRLGRAAAARRRGAAGPPLRRRSGPVRSRLAQPATRPGRRTAWRERPAG